MKVTCEYDIKNDKIESLVVSALEGGYSPWLHQFRIKESTFRTPAESQCPWYGHADFYDGDFAISCVFDEPKGEEGEGNGHKIITNADFKKGLRIMARKYPRHFGDMMNDNADAITGDVFMQCVIFGEVHYG